ncbi:hypothetical protein TAMA11512_21670 [Selenomonas sp. TAMA-11512]|uniref:hypothetical protein n=1 Tax=Selenomonas sp. TAMA-11512 TaxID=3095337 RepID=UPI003093657E|nr:hypothetical protein TAMA11512_21670 [Selenomonas sp. TAMA-11512]
MTRDKFAEIAEKFTHCEASLCAAYIDDALATASYGPTEAVITAALQVIIDTAKRGDNPLRHLITASGILHTVMLDMTKEKPEAAATTSSNE